MWIKTDPLPPFCTDCVDTAHILAYLGYEEAARRKLRCMPASRESWDVSLSVKLQGTREKV